MPIVHVNGVEESHVRFVFTDAVVSLPLAEDATFQDVALTCLGLASRNHGALVSIVVALKPQEANSADSMQHYLRRSQSLVLKSGDSPD